MEPFVLLLDWSPKVFINLSLSFLGEEKEDDEEKGEGSQTPIDV